MAITFIPNPAGIAAIAAEPLMVAEMNRRGQRVEQAAKANAPVLTGKFRDSIRVESGVGGGSAVSRVLSDDEAAPYIEFGTSDTPTFATLRQALQAAGGL